MRACERARSWPDFTAFTALTALAALTTLAACGARAELGDVGDVGREPPGDGASCALAAEAPAVCPTGAATLVTNRTPITLRTDATHVIYTTSPGGPAGPVSLLEAVPLGGGAPTTLYTFAPDANETVWTPRGGNVYLNDGQGFLRVPLDGSGPEAIYTGAAAKRAWYLDADDDALYFGNRDNLAGTEALYRLPLSGGAPTKLAEITFTWGYSDFSPNQDIQVAVDGCSLYWLHKPTIPENGGSNDDGAVYRVSTSGGAATRRIDNLAGPTTLALTEDAVWVVDDAYPYSSPRVIGAGKDGSARPSLSFGDHPLAAVVFDAGAVDYVLYGPPEDLGAQTGWWTQPLDGSAAPALITGAPIPAVSVQGVFGGTIDRACRSLYSLVPPDLIRQPLP